MSRTVIRGAHVISMDPSIPDSVTDITVDDTRISAVGLASSEQADHEIDGGGFIAIPGFVDTHRHTWQSVLRHGYADLNPLQYFNEMLRGIGAAYAPQDVEVGNELGAVSAISAGTTTLVDWSHIQNTPEHTDGAIRGLRTSGIRAVFAHGWPLTDDGQWTTDSDLQHPRDLQRVQSEHFTSEDDLLTLAMAARGPEMANERVWRADLELARGLGIRTTVHVGAYAHNGARKAVLAMHEAGMVGPDLTFVHCCRSSDRELQIIAEAGATVSLGVQCEMNSMGMGDIPLDRLLAAGIRPSLSGDTETKCSGDMFTQMRMLFGYYRSWVGGGHSHLNLPYELKLRDVLEFATIEGARAAGLESEIGSITPGKQADIALIRATDLNIAPVVDPVAAVVLAAHEGNVDTVLIAGRKVKSAGRLADHDPEPLLERARQSQTRILAAKRDASSAADSKGPGAK